MTSQYHETAVEELKNLYIFRNEAQIVEFLDEHPTLYDFLRQVQPILQGYFPVETFTLEMTTSHEDENDQVLFIYIETKRDVDEAMDILDDVIDNYWVHLPAEIRINLAVNVDFK